MPTPVKHLVSTNAVQPTRGGAAPAGPQAAEGETFRDELVRRRRGAAPKSEPARKAEPKRATKARKAVKAAREGRAPEAAAGQADTADAPVVEGARGVGESEATDAAAVAAPQAAETEEAEEPDVRAEVTPLIAPTVHVELSDAGEPQTDTAPGQVATVDGATTPQRLAKQIEYPGTVEAQNQQSPNDVTGPPGPAAPGLFTDVPQDAGEGGTDADGDRAPAERSAPSAPADSSAAAESLREFESGATGTQRHPRTTTDGADFIPAATAGVTDAKPEAKHSIQPALSTPALPPEARFAADNYETIVTSMRAELLPNGGSMRLRLDPPQLGALQVTVQIQDGLITAAFETTSDEATRLLGHSLNQLKGVLESHGVAIDKLQVQQAPRETQTSNANDDARRGQGGQSQEQEQSARQEQQRREMLRKMWQRLAGGQDPLDLTA